MQRVLLHVLLLSLPLLLYLLESPLSLITDTIFPPFVFQHARNLVIFDYFFFQCHIFFFYLSQSSFLVVPPLHYALPFIVSFPADDPPTTKLWSPSVPRQLSLLPYDSSPLC